MTISFDGMTIYHDGLTINLIQDDKKFRTIMYMQYRPEWTEDFSLLLVQILV